MILKAFPGRTEAVWLSCLGFIFLLFFFREKEQLNALLQVAPVSLAVIL